jgi:hypothetical protein
MTLALEQPPLLRVDHTVHSPCCDEAIPCSSFSLEWWAVDSAALWTGNACPQGLDNAVSLSSHPIQARSWVTFSFDLMTPLR